MIVASEDVAKFVSERLSIALCPPYAVLGIEREGQVKCGVVLNHFEGADVHITAAGRGWTRGFMAAIGDYVYNQLGCERMTFVTRSEEVARLAEKLGGVREGLLRSHFGAGHDGIIIGVLREEYRY